MAVLSELNGDWAPNPNTLIIAFWQHIWEALKGDLMAVFYVSERFHSCKWLWQGIDFLLACSFL